MNVFTGAGGLRTFGVTGEQHQFGIPVCAPEAAPSNPPKVVARAAGENHGTGGVNPALPIAAERIDDSVCSRFLRGVPRPVEVVHCLPGDALILAPADNPVSIPVSTTSSPDEKSALVIHHDSVEQVVAR